MTSASSTKRKRSQEDTSTPPDKTTAITRKRTRTAASAVSSSVSKTVENDEVNAPEPVKATKSKKQPPEEKRLARFRAKAPQSYADYHHRALTQRMFALDRTRSAAHDCPHAHPSCPSETIALAGTTGNIYNVTITHRPSCTCPNFVKGNPQCKHIVHVLVKILKAPQYLSYQLAFLTSELETIFENAGPLPTDLVGETGECDNGRRHDLDGDCAICCEPLEGEELVWCRAACGNNLHKRCFGMWAATKKGGQVTCPYCRSPWQTGDGELKNLVGKGVVGGEGYVNVAAELGISGERDWDTYHQPWVRQTQRGYGRRW